MPHNDRGYGLWRSAGEFIVAKRKWKCGRINSMIARIRLLPLRRVLAAGRWFNEHHFQRCTVFSCVGLAALLQFLICANCKCADKSVDYCSVVLSFFTKSSANIFACVITVSTAFSCKSGG